METNIIDNRLIVYGIVIRSPNANRIIFNNTRKNCTTKVVQQKLIDFACQYILDNIIFMTVSLFLLS